MQSSDLNDIRASVSIVVIDDKEVVHAGLQRWCDDAEPPIKIVGDYLCAAEFLADFPIASVGVDVVSMDLQLQSGTPEFSALRMVCAAGHRVVVYSHIAADEVITTCLEIGAVAYIVKSEKREHLLEALRTAATDEPYVGPRMAAALLNEQRRERPSLAPREKEVLVAWFQTETKEHVAQKLFIAPSTVRTHLQRIRAKYIAAGRPAGTKAALVARAIQDGIISVDDL